MLVSVSIHAPRSLGLTSWRGEMRSDDGKGKRSSVAIVARLFNGKGSKDICLR